MEKFFVFGIVTQLGQQAEHGLGHRALGESIIWLALLVILVKMEIKRFLRWSSSRKSGNAKRFVVEGYMTEEDELLQNGAFMNTVPLRIFFSFQKLKQKVTCYQHVALVERESYLIHVCTSVGCAAGLFPSSIFIVISAVH